MIYLKSKEFFLNSSTSITTELREPQQLFPEHSHSFEEIIIVSKGNGIHVINEIPMKLSKNYVCFVNKKDRHLFEHVDDLFLSNILYKRDKLNTSIQIDKYLPQQLGETVDWFIDDQTGVRVNYIIERLNLESHINSIESRAMSELLFQQLIVELWRGKIQDMNTLSRDDRIIYCMVYMIKNYDKPLNIEILSEHAKLPSRMLTNALKKITGMNFTQYLHFIRAKNAMSLLINTEKSITDIAFLVGYSDSNYFSTKFKQTMNKKPSDLR